jgi:hypothetical protein
VKERLWFFVAGRSETRSLQDTFPYLGVAHTDERDDNRSRRSRPRADPGYAQPPGLQTIYFGERGSGDFEGAHLFDLALTHDIAVFGSFRPYVKLDVRNVFSDQTLGDGVSGWNTTFSPDENGPVDANGIPTGYMAGPNFGKATGNGSYPIPREFRVAVGFRF